MSLPPTLDDRVLRSHQTASSSGTHFNGCFLNDTVSVEDDTDNRYLTSKKRTDPLEGEMDKEDIITNSIVKQEIPDFDSEFPSHIPNEDGTSVADSLLDQKDIIHSLIKQQIPDSGFGDSILKDDKPSVPHSLKSNLDDSKNWTLLKPIKAEISVFSNSENQEEILPDLEDTQVVPVKSETERLQKTKSDAFQGSIIKCENFSNTNFKSEIEKKDTSKSHDERKTNCIINNGECIKKMLSSNLHKILANITVQQTRSKITHKEIKQTNGSEKKDINEDLVTKVKSCVERNTTSCKKSDYTKKTKVSADYDSESNNQDVDEHVGSNSDGSESFEEKIVSDNSICSGNIFCDCNNCKKFGEKLLTTKCKPDIEQKYNCGFCNKKFLRKRCFKLHQIRKCDTLKLFPCNLCTKAFTRNSSLKVHVRQVHEKSDCEKKLGCNLCGRCFCFKKDVDFHKRSVHGFLKIVKMTYSCDLCQKIYKRKSGLSRHMMDFHSFEEFECGHCSKIYNNKRSLGRHISAHFWTPLKCSEPSCNKTFNSDKALQNHQQFFHAKLPQPCFICETCGKSLKSKLSLKNHTLTHTDEKHFMCQVCGKNFRTHSNLEQHSRTHSDKPRFSCELCPKAFRIKNHLRQHMAVHGMASTSVKRNQRSNKEEK